MEDSSEGAYDYEGDSYEDDEHLSDANMSEEDSYHPAEIGDSVRRVRYAIFKEAELKARQELALSQVTSVLDIPQEEAAALLRLYKWDASRVNEEWWADVDAVRGKLGLVDEQPEPSTSGKSGKLECQICFEQYTPRRMFSAACKHYFCKGCWKGYVSSAINQGPTVLNLRCPSPECQAAVPQAVIRASTSPEEQQRYDRFELRSYVENNRNFEWCPAPDCEYAVECLIDTSGEAMDVNCFCGCAFCFTCKEEAHRPVDCATVKKWTIKNGAESENLNWILANTKPCPRCKRPIEKNQGCMHMTCSQCAHQFCWLCLAPWAEHGERTGGFFACNRYESARRKGEYDEQAQRREHAKLALERYMHYYQRWAENHKAMQAAIKKTSQVQETSLGIVSNKIATPTSQLKYIADAWNQVVECRRILKWTYAFGYYNFDESIERKLSPQTLAQQKSFFEFNQGQAEIYLERLHGVAENELEDLVAPSKWISLEEWDKFREKLIGLTDVTQSHFRKLAQELEKGMDSMLEEYQVHPSDAQAEPRAASKASGHAKNSARDRKPKPRATRRTRAAQRKAGGAAASEASDLLDMDSEAEESLGFWQCRSCTYANQDLGANHCEICNTVRRR